MVVLLGAVAAALEQDAVLLVPEGDAAAAAVHQDVRLVGPLAHRVAATVTRCPCAVVTRTQEVSSASMSLACASSVSMPVTSSARVEPPSARAVATACARGWSAPRRSRRRRPAAAAPTRAPGGSRPRRAPTPRPRRCPPPRRRPPGRSARGRPARRAEPSDWNPTWQATPALGDPVGHPAELGVRGCRGLLEEQVHPFAGGGQGEVGVGGDRRADHGDPGAGGVEQGAEVGGLLGEFSAGLLLGQRGQLADAGQPDQSGPLQAADVGDVPTAVAAAPARTTGTGLIPSPPPR